MSPETPEQRARHDIDSQLAAAGWLVQDRAEMNLTAGPGVAVREFKMADGHGFADYMLFVEGKAVGVLEAKPAGYPLTSVELQADKYATGLPEGLNPPVNPLPFLYMGTGVETRFINGLDPEPKTRRISDVPHIHRPRRSLNGSRPTRSMSGSSASTPKVAASIPPQKTLARPRSAPASRRCRPWSRASSIRIRSRPSPTWSTL